MWSIFVKKNIFHITGSLLHAHYRLPVPPLPLLQQAARRVQKHGWIVIENIILTTIYDIILTKLQQLLQKAAR